MASRFAKVNGNAFSSMHGRCDTCGTATYVKYGPNRADGSQTLICERCDAQPKTNPVFVECPNCGALEDYTARAEALAAGERGHVTCGDCGAFLTVLKNPRWGVRVTSFVK